MLDVVSGHRAGDAYNAPGPARPFVEEVGSNPGHLRIGLLVEDATGVAAVDPECAKAATETADLLSVAGHEVVEAFPDQLRNGTWPEQFLPCIPMLIRRELERLGKLIGRALTADDVEPATWAMVEGAPAISAADYAAGVDSLRAYGAALELWWEEEGFDLLLTPTLPTPPPSIGSRQDPDGVFTETLETLTPETFTVPYNVSGQPAISVPMHWTPDGLPVGIQLVAAYGREDVLLRVASALEQAAPWAERRPPVVAATP